MLVGMLCQAYPSPPFPELCCKARLAALFACVVSEMATVEEEEGVATRSCGSRGREKRCQAILHLSLTVLSVWPGWLARVFVVSETSAVKGGCYK
jgi:hypothetical protein